MKVRYFTLLALTASLLCAGCDPRGFEVTDAAQYSRIFMQSAHQNPVQHSLPMEDTWHDIPLGAGLGGIEEIHEDITVSFRIDTGLVHEFNLANGTDYPVIKEGSYRLSENSVTIPAGKTGSNSAMLQINPMKFGGTRAFMIPVSVSGVSNGIPIHETLHTTYYLIKGVYEENPYEIYSQEGWTIHSYSSDEDDSPTTGGRARHAIDGSLETFWHSQWRRDENGYRPDHPHFIAVDMNEVRMMHGLIIHGRQNQVNGNGNARDIIIELSMDGENWTEAGRFALQNELESNTVYFEEAREARYFKMTVLASHQNVYRTHTAEIQAF